MKKIIIKKLLRCIPDCFFPLKNYILKRIFLEYGNNFKMGKGSIIVHPENTIVKNDVYIGENFYASTIKKLYIGNRVMFGPRCSIIGGDHYYDSSIENMRYTKIHGNNKDIIIEDDTWIGFGVLILKKATIGEGSIIGANSLVNSKIDPYCVYAGNPAKKIKTRFKSYKDLILYLEMMNENFNFTSKYTAIELKKIYEK